MLTVTVAQLKADIAQKMKGTSLSKLKDPYGLAGNAADRMLARVDTDETRRTMTLSTPFWENVNDYVLATDYKGMIDIRPQADRICQPGDSNYSQTTPRQFNEQLTPDSFSIRWNSMVRTLRAQVLPSGTSITLDTFDGPTGAGSWSAEGDASGLYTEPLNYIQGTASLGFNLSGATGSADIVNTTAPVTDLSAYDFEDASFIYVYLPIGSSAQFTSFELRRGASASSYIKCTVSTKGDGTAFTDGWNFLVFQWSLGQQVGGPVDNTQNTYRRFGIAYATGTAINGFLIDSWTNDLGNLYEMEYYSECLFRSATGAWKYVPTDDTDFINVGPASYEILKTEMMIDVTQIIRQGAIRSAELADWRLMLNGQPQSRYVKDPPYHGLYQDYLLKFPSSRILTVTRLYNFDV